MLSAHQLVQAVYSGLVIGSIYALLALGFTLIYGALRFLNLALGSLFTLGGYTAWVVTGEWGLPPVFGVLAAFAFVALVGALMYQGVVRPMVGRPGWDIATIISTLGVGIVIENLLLREFGPRNKALPLIANGGFNLGNTLHVDYQELVIVGVCLVILGGMAIFLTRSRHGLAIRAVAQNRDAAYLAGISVHLVFTLVMAISAGLAGVAGVLLNSITFLNPTVGLAWALKGLVVTILGGLGSITGTLYAAVIVGLLESFVSVRFGSGWSVPALFVFLIVLLVVRPGGIAGIRDETRV
jgi:branched-subunit amino acid ABC-type transport system permease component